MRKILYFLTVLSSQVFAQQKFELATPSQITWKGFMVVGGSHQGTLTPRAGSFTTSKEGKIIRGDFTMDMSSIRSTDVKPAKSAKELEDHLKSTDFFAVDQYPNAFFSILKIAPAASYPNKDNYTVTGLLMIKGISNQIVFPASVVIADGLAHVKADLQFDRTKWGIVYHSGTFFASAKDELISDLIRISIDMTFVEKK